MAVTEDLSSRRFYHGTRADLRPGDLIELGFNSNFGKGKKAVYVYLTATLDAPFGAPNWRSVKGPAESTSWNQAARLKMILI